MKKPEAEDTPETLYVLYYKGKPMSARFGKSISEDYGQNDLYGWRPPKKVYYELRYARSAAKRVPEKLRKFVTIVEYGPTLNVLGNPVTHPLTPGKK